jgi:hypothetical protein
VLERIVDNWLISAGERGYETAFAQLLASEQHRVLHAPVHHPYEHGKDILTRAPDGSLHAYQLKGGNIGLADFEDIQAQLFALAGTAVAYPGVESPRRPDRAFLVTNGRLTAPARDRLNALNQGGRGYGFPVIEAIERDQLVSRFVAAHGKYMPANAANLNELLQIMLNDGIGTFPNSAHATLLTSIAAQVGSDANPIEVQRALASCVILTAYALGPWESASNHFAVAEAWMTAAIFTIGTAERHDLSEEHWHLSYTLCRDSARNALQRLLKEVAARDDLMIPDLTEGLVYGTRAAQVCGMCSAFYLSERCSEDSLEVNEDELRRVLLRERPHMRATGEAGIPALLLVACALEMLGHPGESGAIVFGWASELIVANQPGSGRAIADPYHAIEDVLLMNFGEEFSASEETFAGETYTVHIALEWLARRGVRELVQDLYPNATRLHYNEYAPSSPSQLLSHHDEDGELRTWALPQPGSWASLSRASALLAESAIPARLWRDTYCLAFLPLLYPQRLTSDVAKALDYIVSQYVEIQFDPVPEGHA